jgi:hypothetical protein
VAENETALRARPRLAPRPGAPFPFVVGCHRSGTTLLRAMLDSHPALAIPGESHFVAALARPHRRRRFETRRGLDVGLFLDVVHQSHHFRDWELPEAEVVASLTAPPATDVADAIRRLYALYALRQDKVRYGDKTPAYVLAVPAIARLFPEARFVHIVRDGRDVALSNLAISEWGPRRLTDAALWWKQRVGAGRRAGRRLGPHRYLEVGYEQLVRDPESVLRAVCAFLELDFDERLLQFSSRADAILSSVRYPHQHERLRQGPTPGLRDWRAEMEPDDVMMFEALAGGLLGELGYERRYRPVPPHARARAVRAVWQARTRHARTRAGKLRRQMTNGRAWSQLARAMTRRGDRSA